MNSGLHTPDSSLGLQFAWRSHRRYLHGTASALTKQETLISTEAVSSQPCARPAAETKSW